MSTVGIIHPGAMGISIAASAQAAGHTVYWASAERSATSRQRATQHNLLDAETVARLCECCDVILCVCPPHAAEAVAESALEAGFTGLYCDGNAISPEKARRIGERMRSAGCDFVDGGIIGPPAWEKGSTRFYLSGSSAAQVAALFIGSVTEAIDIGAEVGRASALKMVFAAQTKGTTALLSAVQAAAEALSVRGDLDGEWARRLPDAAESRAQPVRSVTAKAWRFTGEMQEIAATFAEAGLPDGFHLAAYEVYRRMAGFKDAEATPPLEDVLAALLDEN
ncbi:MAG: NAD(P)-dependent oxidoreductase [Chloroflexi bacterium]|nr:NAD(P)-dependent oxidoreductase [Chloroflexota bacterium]